MNIGLKTRILERGLSQVEFSREIKVSENHLSRIIRGWDRPSPELKERMAGALGARVEELFPGGQDEAA